MGIRRMDLSITYKDIVALEPCYDPIKYVDSDWQGTLIDVLKMAHVPAQDRLWVVKRFLNKKPQRLFLVFCARQILKTLGECTEAVEAIDVAEKYAHGTASFDELESAMDHMLRVLRRIESEQQNANDEHLDEDLAIACNVALYISQQRVTAYTHRLITQKSGINNMNNKLKKTLSQQQVAYLIELLE